MRIVAHRSACCPLVWIAQLPRELRPCNWQAAVPGVGQGMASGEAKASVEARNESQTQLPAQQ